MSEWSDTGDSDNDAELSIVIAIDEILRKGETPNRDEVLFAATAVLRQSTKLQSSAACGRRIRQAINKMKARNAIEIRADVLFVESRASAQIKLRLQEVFLVHGHGRATYEMVARFLQGLGLRVTILRERPIESRPTLTKFVEEARRTAFAVVVMTGDDVGHAVNSPEDTQLRARQNVIFELGYFLGLLGPTQVCALIDSDLERPSDILGVNYIMLDDGGVWKSKLAVELKNAGIIFDYSRLLGE